MITSFLFLILNTGILAESGVLVRTSPPKQETIVQAGTYPAEILPYRRATLAAEWVGPITSIQVEAFEKVEAGQILAQLDTALLKLQIEEAKANQVFAEKQLIRFRGLHAKQAVTEQAFIEVERNFTIANSTLERFQIQLEKATVRAPWSGFVQKRWVDVGDYVVQGQALFDLVDHSQYRVRASVSGKDALNLELGKKATLFFQNQDDTIDSTIERLAPELVPSSRSLIVEAVIEKGKVPVKPGMVAYLKIQHHTITNALLVPLSAILQFENGKGVYVVVDGKAERRFIKTGDIYNEDQVVLEGLGPEDLVIIEGQTRVSNGSKVLRKQISEAEL